MFESIKNEKNHNLNKLKMSVVSQTEDIYDDKYSEDFEHVFHFFSDLTKENVHDKFLLFFQSYDVRNISPLSKKYLEALLSDFENTRYSWPCMPENSTLGDFISYFIDFIIACYIENEPRKIDILDVTDEAEYYENKIDCDFRQIRCSKVTNNGKNKKNGRSKRTGKQIKDDIKHEIDSYIKGSGLHLIRVGDDVGTQYYGRVPRQDLHKRNRPNKYRRVNEKKKRETKEFRDLFHR